MEKHKLGTLIIALLFPLLVGGLSAFLSADGMALYSTMEKPPLSPPPWVFSVAWTILYIMMGRASYFILISEDDELHNRSTAIKVYLLQLAINFMWSIIFFNWGEYLAALIWLLVLLCVVIICIKKFYKVSNIAAYMMVPYCLWLIFASYLNLGTYILNRK